ncbi:MAG TPA: transglutaminaseTgpA domain-containing protein [Solirubrobacterales bacterium]|nr:transglutaminaseTgpA domain-containing protein [Solirubrobacterales bacterium]
MSDAAIALRAAGSDAGEAPRIAPAPLAARELTVFAALGAFGILQWSRLLSDPPIGAMFASLLAACATGAALLLIGRRRVGRRSAAAWTIGVGGALLCLVVAGLSARLLLPENWGELSSGIGTGLTGIESVTLPYQGADEWVRLTLVLGVPAMLASAALLAFWPGERRERRRVLALIPLIAMFAIAVALDAPGGELPLGIVLLVLICAWMWIVRLRGERAGVATLAAVAASFLALPLAARLDSTEFLNYRDWTLFGSDHGVTFDWNHRYGPLDWPRNGTKMLEVSATQPVYWKASVLDRFDGIVWRRAEGDDGLALAERAARPLVDSAGLIDRHPEWVSQANFEVKALASAVGIGFGTPRSIDGLDAFLVSNDGTISLQGEPLEQGDDYSVAAYWPEPTARQLENAPTRYPERRFGGTTLVALPVQGAPAAATRMPLWGQRDPDVERAVLTSPYADTYRLARGLTAAASTPYEAARTIEHHLRDGDYKYTASVERHEYPLDSFLFDDRAGYCQQFAGSMALMLRLIGIPARVVSGFAPGQLDPETNTYVIRDLDAHSWVEVYFRGIGWVTFDPTPPAAPASSQSSGGGIGSPLGDRGAAVNLDDPGQATDAEKANPKHSPTGSGGNLADDGSGGPAGLVILLLLAVTGAAFGAVSWRRRRRLARGEAVGAQIAELRDALDRLSWQLGEEPTLLRIERRFAEVGRTSVATYAARLRLHLYGRDGTSAPGPAERRAMRRAIARTGLRNRLRALFTIPPGGPAGASR